MLGVTHMASGAAAGAWLGVLVAPTPGLAVAGIGAATVAALSPDLDHFQSRGTKALWIIGWILCHLIRAASRLCTGRAHRGLSHSVLFALALGGLTAGLSVQWLPGSHAAYLGVAVAVGVVAALLGDLVTRAGLDCALWPLDVEVSVPKAVRIRTGGPFETLVVLPVMVLAAIAGFVVLTGMAPELIEGVAHGSP